MSTEGPPPSGKVESEYKLEVYEKVPVMAGRPKPSERIQYLWAAAGCLVLVPFLIGLGYLYEQPPQPRYGKSAILYAFAVMSGVLALFSLWKAWTSPRAPTDAS